MCTSENMYTQTMDEQLWNSCVGVCPTHNVHICIRYGGKYLWDEFFADFAVGLTSAKYNPRIRHNCVVISHSKPSSTKILFGEFSFFEPSAKICPAKFPTIGYLSFNMCDSRCVQGILNSKN